MQRMSLLCGGGIQLGVWLTVRALGLAIALSGPSHSPVRALPRGLVSCDQGRDSRALATANRLISLSDQTMVRSYTEKASRGTAPWGEGAARTRAPARARGAGQRGGRCPPPGSPPEKFLAAVKF